VHPLLRRARLHRPHPRVRPGDAGFADRVINQLLTELDGLEARKTIVTIGATNQPALIDPAIVRPVRLDQLIYIPLPDEPARISIFKANMRKVAVAENVSFDALGHAIEGFSGADIAEICNRASRFATKMCLQEHISRERQKEELIKAGREIPAELDDDSIYVVKKQHFDLAMRNARKSVSEDQIAKYPAYAQANSLAQGRGFSDARPSPSFGNPDPGGEF
jgi:transitional endoplasmic reticulum ATPase